MQLSSKAKLNLRRIIMIGLGLILAGGLYLSLEKEFSWAAPNQSPNQQTVPPRPPDPDPPPPDSDSEPPSGDEDYDDDDDGDVSPPPPPADPTEEPQSPPPVPNPVDEDDSPAPADESDRAPPLPPPTTEAEPVDLPQEQPVGEEAGDPAPPEVQEEVLAEPDELEINEATIVSGAEQADALLAPQEADLSLNLLSDKQLNLVVNEEVELTITVHNDGPDNATSVSIAKLLPPGLELRAVDASMGIFNETEGMWTISAIAPGLTGTLTLVVNAASPEQVTNISEIVAVDQFDPDSTPANNLRGEDDQISIFVKTTAGFEVEPETEPVRSTESKSTSDPVIEPSSNNGFASLTWLCTLGLGLLLILGGVILTRRSQS